MCLHCLAPLPSLTVVPLTWLHHYHNMVKGFYGKLEKPSEFCDSEPILRVQCQ